MEKFIWSKEELNKIRQNIFRKTNLTLDENRELKEANTRRNVCKDYNINKTFVELKDELFNLFYINDREKIQEVLNKTKAIKADPTNRLHYGLIMTLSKIDPTKHEEIFTIFKEIICQYDKSVAVVANKIIENHNSSTEIRNLINKISTSTETTIEEQLVKNEINKIFIFSNGVTDDELFSSLIEKLDTMIKPKLITFFKRALNNISKIEAKIDDEYFSERNEKIRKRYKEIRKKIR